MKWRRYLLLFILSIFLPLQVFASEVVTLNVDKKDLQAGDEITVEAIMPDDLKLYAMTATLNYDRNVFEEIETSNFIGEKDVVDILYNPDNSKFGLINKTGEISSKLFSIKLRVKKNAHVGNSTIALTNISSSDGNNKTEYDMTEVEVLVTRDAKDGEVIPSNEDIKYSDTKEDEIKVSSNRVLVLISAIGTISVLICLIYFIYKKQDKKIIIGFTGAFVVFAIMLTSLLVFNNQRMDVNNDGTKDYDDAKEIIKYLIDFEGSKKNEDKETPSVTKKPSMKKTTTTKATTEKPSNQDKPNKPGNPDYDVNNDGKVDIDDAGGSAADTTEKTKYKVTLSSNEKENYANRGKITLDFNASVNPNERIKEVYIDGKYYEVLDHGDHYTVELDTPNTPGNHTFEITKVKLVNYREIDTSLKIEKEILKLEPYVDSFDFDEKNDTLTFKLEDPDSSFVKGTIEILDKKNDTVLTEELKLDNKITYNFAKETEYTVIINASYDLDNDVNNKDNYYEDKTIYSHVLSISANYEFNITDLRITDAIEKGSKPVIEFKSSNIKDYKVEYIEIDGVRYNVSPKYDKDEYLVELSSLDTDEFGKYHINIDKVEISNYKVFERGKDYETNTLSYTVLKNAPQVEDIKLDVNKENQEIAVTYKVIDKDSTLGDLSVHLYDANSKLIDVYDDVKNTDKVTLSYKGNISGGYEVRFVADYNLGTDRHNYTDVALNNAGITTQNDVNIISVDSGVLDNSSIYWPTFTVTPYPYKNQIKYQVRAKVKLSEEIVSKYNRVAGLTINGVNFDSGSNTVDKNNEVTSTISFTVPSESGLQELHISRVKLAFESYQGVSQTYVAVNPVIIKIDVLKDKPTIEDLEIVSEDYDAGKVTFRFRVQSDKGGFDGGKVSLGDESYDITEGTNEVTFENVPKNQKLDLVFKGDYDLDTNEIHEDENKNYYKDQELYKTSYTLMSEEEYNDIKIKDLSVLNNKKYFDKDEVIDIKFALDSDIDAKIDRFIYNDEEYYVNYEDGIYTSILDGFKTSGIKDIKISGIILDNGKKINLDDEGIKVEVLKDKVSVYDYRYELEEDNIKLSILLKDNDHSLKKDSDVTIKVFDEDNKELYSYEYNKEIKIPLNGNIRYYIKAYAKYDLDESYGNENYHEKELLLDEVISLDKNYIEIKDIMDVTLYKNSDEAIKVIDRVSVSDIEKNPDAYFVKIMMKSLPTVHAKIKKALEEDGKLILILDYEYVVKDSTKERQDLRIEFGTIDNEGMANNEVRPLSLEGLIEKINSDPDAHITLTRDYDFTDFNVDTDTYFTSEFRGTIDGNNHTLRNLSKPLFKTLNGATIENLHINNATLKDSASRGLIANTASEVTIKKVLIKNLEKTNGDTKTGGLIGEVNGGTIEEVKISNLKLSTQWAKQQIGGLVGNLNNATIKNSYVVGTISGTWNYSGSIVGNSVNSEISNSMSRLSFTGSPNGSVICELACSTGGNNTYKNNVIMVTGAQSGFAGRGTTVENNYRLVSDGSESNTDGITHVAKGDISTQTFKNAKFSEDIWNLKDVTYNNYPTFVSEKASFLDLSEDLDGYEEEKELLYANLMKLMPFYDSKKIVETGKSISMDNELATNYVQHVIPLDKKGNIVTYLTSNDVKKISKIKLVFADNKVVTYDVIFDKIYDMVASYRISSLKIDYTFDHYVIDSDSQLINNLTNYLNGLTYEDNLDTLTKGDDSRIYKDFYNDVTKHELKEFVLKYIANSDYAITFNNETISDYLERELKNDKNLIRTLYVYNYFRRFYDVDINGMKLYDFMLFGADGFAEEMDMKGVVDAYLKDAKNFDLNRTSDAYKDTLSKYTYYDNIPAFLEYLVKLFGDEDVADWYAHQFKGYLVELNVDGYPDIQYRLWDHIKTKDKNTGVTWYNYCLPIITLPEKSAYIISMAGQFVIGAQRTYMNDPYNAEEQKGFETRVKTYTTRMKDYYDTAAAIIDDVTIFNNIHTIQIDKRFAYENGVLTFQSPYSTEEPFHKNFNEVIGQWAYPDGNAATANGAYIIWRAEGCLDGDWTYSTWSHETAHNMDARLFLKDNGRRFDAGGEDYADGNLTQSFGEADIVMNLSFHFDKDKRIAANLDPSRINSKAKIEDFYKKLFDTVYIMDYLEGQAFLNLTPEEQAMLAVQASYPREATNTLEGHEYLRRQHTFYSEVSVDDIKSMNLHSLEDLYKNRLLMYPGVIASTLTTNRYGGENILKVRWYQPHNDYGRPDSYSIKWWAYEMLGYAGYNNGYVEYYSNIHSEQKTLPNVASDGKSYAYDKNGVQTFSTVNYKTDLMALRTITKDNNITFESYRKMRFDNVEKNLANIQYINVNEYYTKFLNALREDAKKVKEAKDKALELYPDGTEDAINKRNTYVNNSKVKNFDKSSAVRKDLYYAIKQGSNDFTKEVYDSTKQQTINPFTK